jgi:hypothetical protein
MFKLNLNLLLLFLFSMLNVILIKLIWHETPEWFGLGEELGVLIFELSIGYIVSYFFYLLVVRIPEIQTTKKVNKRLATPLSRSIFNIREVIYHLISSFSDLDKKNITEEQFIEISKRVNLGSDAPIVILSANLQPGCYGFYLIEHIGKVKEYCKQILEFPGQLDPELIVIIDEILYSKYHELIEAADRIYGFQSNNRINTTLEVYAKDLFMYYKLSHRLEDYMKNNKIDLTIEFL